MSQLPSLLGPVLRSWVNGAVRFLPVQDLHVVQIAVPHQVHPSVDKVGSFQRLLHIFVVRVLT